MTSIFYVLIILPLIIIALLTFVFQSSVLAIRNQEYLVNCPYPIFNGNVTVGNPAFINGVRINYTITVQATTNQTGTYFDCRITNNSPAVNIISKHYGKTDFGIIATGWNAWFADTITSFFGKAQPQLTVVYLMFNAPAIVTGLAWFAYAELFMLFLIGLGIFMVIRG